MQLLVVADAEAKRRDPMPDPAICAELDYDGNGALDRDDLRILKDRMKLFKLCRSSGVMRDGVCDAADLDDDGVVDRRDRKLLAPLVETLRECVRHRVRAATKMPSVLLLGLDSAGWRYLDVLRAKSYLPTIDRLLAEGARADMSCVPANPSVPCFCPMVWGSISTGVPSDQHGLTSFDVPAEERMAPALWEVLEEQRDGRSMLIGWHNTSTSEHALDVVVTDPALVSAATHAYDSYSTGLLTDPAELAETKPEDLFASLGMLDPEVVRPLWAPIAEDRVSMETLTRTALRPKVVGHIDLTMLVMRTPDRVAHVLWGWLQTLSGQPFIDNNVRYLGDRWQGPVYMPSIKLGAWYDQFLGIGFGIGDPVAVYRDIDSWLAKLLYWKPYDYVVLASDHAMTRDTKFAPFLSGHHHNQTAFEARLGIFSVTGPGVKAGVAIGRISVLDAAPTIAHLLGLQVAQDLPGRVRTELFEPEWLAEHPVETVPSWR